MEFENKYASKGVAGAGLGLGIAGAALGVLNGGLGNIFGSNRSCGCSEDHYINRYEASQSARIAELETEVKLRDANTYTDTKLLEVYRYVDGRLNGVEAQICQQNVVNAQVAANLSCLQNTVATLSGLTKPWYPSTISVPHLCLNLILGRHPPPLQELNQRRGG